MPSRIPRTLLLRFRRAVPAGALLLACASPSAATDGLSLAEAVRVGLRSSTDARIASLETGRADDDLERTRGAYLPQLSVVGQAGYSNRQKSKLKAVDSSGVEKEYGLASIGASGDGWANIYVDQVLLDLNRLRLIEKGSLALEAARISEVQQQEAIALEITQRYLRLFAVERQTEVARERVKHAEWLAEQAVNLHDAGRALSVERDQATLYLEDALIEIALKNGEIDDARSALWLAMHGDSSDGTPAFVLDESSLPSADAEFPEVGQEELIRAPDLRLLDQQRRIDETSVDAERAKRYPTLNIRGGYSHYGIFRFDDFDDQAFVFLGMEIPIFDGFQTKRAVAGAEKTAEIQRLRYRAALDKKVARVRELGRRYDTARERESISQRALATSLERQRLADLNLKAGRGSIERALVARERASRDGLRAIDAHVERVDLWATIQREVGRLGASLGALPSPVP